MSDIKEYPVFCEKYGITGKVTDAAGVVIKLLFTFEGKEFEIGLETSFFLFGAPYEEKASKIMESCIDNIKAANPEERKLKMYYWYVDSSYFCGKRYLQLHGNVINHPRIMDSVSTHTSDIQSMYVDWAKEELVVITRNNTYHCPLQYCGFMEQDEEPELIQEYAKIKEKYEGKLNPPQIDPGKVLLVISNFDTYYFHSLCYIPQGKTEPVQYSAYPHIGSFQDSYLIATKNYDIDLRYFPHFENIEFYSEQTNGLPLYIENIGDITLWCRTSIGTIKIAPGERKEVCAENSEKEVPLLANGDLYPAATFF